MSRQTTEAFPAHYERWSDEEVKLAQEWRAETPPVGFHDIGRRLGRSPGTVRAKLHDVAHAEEYGGPVVARTARTIATPPTPDVDNPDRALCDRVMHSGGFSLRTLVKAKMKNGATVHTLQLLAPNGQPRPQGWRDGMTIDPANHKHMAHLMHIQRWWTTERAKLKAPPIMKDRDA